MEVIKQLNVCNIFETDFIKQIKFITVFGFDKFQSNEVIIVLKNDSVFSFGNNYFGRLGFGNSIVVKTLTKVNELSKQQLIDISFGSTHVLGLTKTGQCMSWGHHRDEKLGYNSVEMINKPKVIEYFTENNLFITSISCGSNHSMVLTNSGVVYTFGNNDYRQLGSEERTGLPQKVEIESTITAISCGGYHCLALNNRGYVYIWGDNRYRQCSANKSSKYCLPFKVEIPSKVCQISCSLTHSLVLTEDKQIYSIGCIECFGTDETDDCSHNSNTIQKPFDENNFTEIGSHSLNDTLIAKSVDSYVYVWGHKVEGSSVSGKKTEHRCPAIAFSQLTQTDWTYKSVFLPEIYVENNNNSKLRENVEKLFDNPKDYDFIFKFKDRKIFVNKFVLKMQCNHFKTLFSENWDKLESNELEIKDISYETYYSFIKYVYTESLQLNNEYVYELYDLANSYFEENLKLICFEQIQRLISNENVLTVYSFALKYELLELGMSCLQFCSNKWNQVLKSPHFAQFEHKIQLQFIRKAAELNLF